MKMRPSNVSRNRTYKFYTSQPVFEFGSGLSYATFFLCWYNESTIVSHSIKVFMKMKDHSDNVIAQTLRLNVTNSDTMYRDDVVLAYIMPPQILLEDVYRRRNNCSVLSA